MVESSAAQDFDSLHYWKEPLLPLGNLLLVGF